jgi:hypothetical protein
MRRSDTITLMLKLASIGIALSIAASALAAEPLIEKEHVTVWDSTGPLPASAHDFVAVSLSKKGTARFGRQGEIPGKAGSHTIVIELKGLPVIPIANETGYPLAFPRKHAKKLLENEQVVVWDYVWHPGEATPMHFHDKDAVVIYEESGSLKSTSPDGKTSVTEFKSGEVRFNVGNRSHREILADGKAHAIITELK